MLLLIGEIVRSGDNVMRCVIERTGDDGESRFIDFARVSAIKRRACSRSLICRSFSSTSSDRPFSFVVLSCSINAFAFSLCCL